jgi:drug/metabolite transporter (DMT)-like permease
MKSYWLWLALLGALLYGTFSLLFGIVAPEIKADTAAQFGYGLLIAIVAFPINTSLFLFWRHKNKKSNKTLFKHINWTLFILLVLFGAATNPLHSIVFNTGGSLGQQTMYSLAILPVLFGGWFILKERLTIMQWIGIILAGSGTFLMNSK